jgi:surface protein
MFENALAFNQSIGSWNVSNVSNMSYMFKNATSFNQTLNSWNTASLSNMIYMFSGATSFNGGDLSTWNVSGVSSLQGVFSGATAFNGLVNGWNTTNVTNMSETFAGCTTFNQNMFSWYTGNVTTSAYMFDNASSFNQLPPTNWIKTRFMNGMFQNAGSFNKNIGDWALYNGAKGANTYSIDMSLMLNGCAMNTENYSKTLIGWTNYGHYLNGGIDNPITCRLSAGGLTYNNTTYAGNYPYTNAVTARAYLVLNTPNVQPGGGRKWTVVGDTQI